MLLKIETQRLVLHKNQNRNNLSRLFHLPPNRMPKIKINNQFNKMNNLKLLSLMKIKIALAIVYTFINSYLASLF